MHATAGSTLPPTTDTGLLGVYHLKRFWAKCLAGRQGARTTDTDQPLDFLVSDALGFGREQVLPFLMREAPSFAAFERWIIDTAGAPTPELVARLNAVIAGAPPPEETQRRLAAIEALPPVLTDEDMDHWKTQGYVILQDAVPATSRRAAEQAIWARLGARPDDPDSWYVQPGIMVQFFQHPAFAANRASARIHKAFAQLWGTADLWCTTDRAGFNAPEREGWKFQGPDLHWDVSLHPPMPFCTQGILYLTDTPAEQGAFTAVPGFQNRLADWLSGLPPEANPRQQDLHGLGSKPIAGRAGDLVIWHQALPHGSRPNRGSRPRIVQYLNYYSAAYRPPAIWR